MRLQRRGAVLTTVCIMIVCMKERSGGQEASCGSTSGRHPALARDHSQWSLRHFCLVPDCYYCQKFARCILPEPPSLHPSDLFRAHQPFHMPECQCFSLLSPYTLKSCVPDQPAVGNGAHSWAGWELMEPTLVQNCSFGMRVHYKSNDRR